MLFYKQTKKEDYNTLKDKRDLWHNQLKFNC